MNKIIYNFSFLLLGIVFFFTACEKERTFPEFHEIEHGVYPRQLGTFTGPNGKDFNYNDPANASVTFKVEFYDDTNGACAETYCWTANHAPTGRSAQIGCLNKSQFGVNPENGRPTAEFTFTLQQALDVLGLTIDSVTGGQAIDFYGTLTTCKGQTFTRINTNAGTQGQPAFKALFQFKSNLICPSDLAGSFDASTTGQAVWAGTPCSSNWTGTVIWNHLGNGIYDVLSIINGVTLHDMSMGAYFACYGGTAESGYPNGTDGIAGNLRIADACGKLSITGLSQWGEAYTINNLTVNGNQLTIDWSNDYGEAAITVLTRTDGKNWPANLRK